MCADEAYCSGRDAGKRRVAPALIPAPHVMPTAALRCPYVAHKPITAAWFIRPARGCGAGASGNGLSNPQTVIYKGGPAT